MTDLRADAVEKAEDRRIEELNELLFKQNQRDREHREVVTFGVESSRVSDMPSSGSNRSTVAAVRKRAAAAVRRRVGAT